MASKAQPTPNIADRKANPMAYPFGNSNQYPLVPSAIYGAYWPQFTSADTQLTAPVKKLVWLVLALGVATYLISYSAVPPASNGWDVRFATLAAIAAALGLIPRPSAHTKLIAALAIMGFLEALSQLITGSQNPGWPTTVMVIVVALQAFAAIAAMMIQLNVFRAPERRSATYDPYAHAQATQQYYYAANHQHRQQEQPVQAHATAQATAAATAQAQQSLAERDALYAEYFNGQQSGPSRAAASPLSDERMQTAQPPFGIGMPTTNTAENIRTATDPGTASPTQTW